MPEREPHDRLEDAMNTRRVALRLTWKEVATRADISYEALRSVRRGDYTPSELTAAGLEVALGWELGSVASVLAGGAPKIADTQHAADGDAELEEARDLLRRAMEMIDRAAERREAGGGRA